MFLDYFALGVLVFVAVTLFYAIIAIHDIPYEMAKHRDHPHQDAIHVAGWVSLFTLHAIWPFLWIWAMLYRPDRGWGMGSHSAVGVPQDAVLASLERRIADLERRSVGEKAENRLENGVVVANSEPRVAGEKPMVQQSVEKL